MNTAIDLDPGRPALRWYQYAALVGFALLALLTLWVSIPATYAALSPFHKGTERAAALVVFEIGAVFLKVIALAIPIWYPRLNLGTLALLILTTGANYAYGYDLSATESLTPTLAALRADPWGGVLYALVASAVFPGLLYAALSAFVHYFAALYGIRLAAVRLPSVRVLAVFEQRLSIAQTEYTIREIAAALDMAPSTLHGRLKGYDRRRLLEGSTPTGDAGDSSER